MLYQVTITFERNQASFRRLWEPWSDDQRFGFSFLDAEAPFQTDNPKHVLVSDLLEAWVQSQIFGPLVELELLNGRVSGVSLRRISRPFDKDHDQDAACASCGHAYYRHFDWADEHSPGCKYCGCVEFAEPGERYVPWPDYEPDDFGL